MPVFMAATPDFVQKSPDTVIAYLKAWLEVSRDFKEQPNKVAEVIYGFFTSKGYSMSPGHVPEGAGDASTSIPASRPTSRPYMQHQAKVLLKEKKIHAIPDWAKALRPDFMEKARVGA